MLTAGLGLAGAVELKLVPAAFADEEPGPLTFGDLEALVALLQETPVDRLLVAVTKRLAEGTDLRRLVGAAALANARTFGGEDYVGFHTMMALAPCFRMAGELPPERRALPVLKVLYRNTNRMQEVGGREKEVLRKIRTDTLPHGANARSLRDEVRRQDLDAAEGTLASLAERSADEAFNAVLLAVEDETEVHRVVLPYRSWCLLDILGEEHAGTLLRQSVHYCVRAENWASRGGRDRPRDLLPRLFDEHGLETRGAGERAAEDAWVDEMSRTIFASTPQQAAAAAAAALAEGMLPDAVGEAISLAANQLVLRDAGRRAREEVPGKPIGSVHGDSIGVHACDSANAWRNMARVSNARNTFACLILGAYQVAFDRIHRGGDFLHWEPLPLQQHVDRITATEPATLLAELDDAIRQNLQARAAAIVHRYGTLGHAARPVFDTLLRYATSEDGALHAEKYYATVSEEFAATRAAFRWRQLVALARVTASEFGRPAPGYGEACKLLAVSA